MFKNKKVINIILDIIIVILIVIINILNIVYKNSNIKQDTIDYSKTVSKQLNDEKNINILKFYDTNISYTIKDKSIISVNIENSSENKYIIKGVFATIYDNDNKKIMRLYSGLILNIEPESSLIYTFETTKNIYDNSYKIEYEPIIEKVEEE